MGFRKFSSLRRPDKETEENARALLFLNFTSVRNSKCTSPLDERRIREAIKGDEDIIDELITKLADDLWVRPPARRRENTTTVPFTPDVPSLDRDAFRGSPLLKLSESLLAQRKPSIEAPEAPTAGWSSEGSGCKESRRASTTVKPPANRSENSDCQDE